MEKDRKITLDNFDEWFRSLGFLLPRTVKELRRFEELYKDYPHEPIKDISIEEAMAFFGDDIPETKILDLNEKDQPQKKWKLVARNQDKLSEEILNKMKKNQEDRLSND